jgi:hypothetical protein
VLAMAVCAVQTKGSVISSQNEGLPDEFFDTIWLHENSFWFFIVGTSIYSFSQASDLNQDLSNHRLQCGADQIAIQRCGRDWSALTSVAAT